MAHIGMKYVVAAKLKDDESYEKGFVVAKAIQFTGTPSSNDVQLYADDGVAERDNSVVNMGTSLNVDDVSLKAQADLLGHTYTAAGTGQTAEPEKIVVSANDVAPYVGMGFYKRRKKNGVTSYTAIWLYKVMNRPVTENAQTKGQNTEFQTDTIEGTADQLTNGDIYEKVVFSSETAAKAWLNKKANITE